MCFAVLDLFWICVISDYDDAKVALNGPRIGKHLMMWTYPKVKAETQG